MRFSQASRIIQAVNDGCNLTLLGICSGFSRSFVSQLTTDDPGASLNLWKQPTRRIRFAHLSLLSIWEKSASDSLSQMPCQSRLPDLMLFRAPIGSSCFGMLKIWYVALTPK